jgi:hypothetical protein
MQRLLRIFAIFAVLGSVLPLPALPKKPDLKKILQEADKPESPYIPARAGWNGPEQPKAVQAAYNPVYERLRAPLTSTGYRAELLNLLEPDWTVLVSFFVVILGARLLRNMRERKTANPAAPGKVVEFPARVERAA